MVSDSYPQSLRHRSQPMPRWESRCVSFLNPPDVENRVQHGKCMKYKHMIHMVHLFHNILILCIIYVCCFPLGHHFGQIQVGMLEVSTRPPNIKYIPKKVLNWILSFWDPCRGYSISRGWEYISGS